MAKASSHIGSDKAVGRLPRLSGKSIPAVRTILLSSGFRLSPTSTGVSEIYVHQDGSQVRIDPAHNPGSPKPNPIDYKPMMSHVRTHYHKLWTDGVNTLSLDDKGYAVGSKTANAHIPGGKKPKGKGSKSTIKEAEFESSWLFEAPSFRQSDRMATVSSNLPNQQWLFELPSINLEYDLDSEADLMLGKTFRRL